MGAGIRRCRWTAVVNRSPDLVHQRPHSRLLLGFIVRLLRVLVAAGLLGLLACASPTPTSTPTATATPAPTPTPPPTPPARRASVVIASPAAPSHLDVHQGVTEALLSLGPGIAYSRLLRLRSGPDVALPTLAVECDLCSSWEHPDQLTYVFHLRPGVRWHNVPPVNGRELTARDVAFSLDRLHTPGWPGAALLQAMASVKATDSLTVTVRLSYPDADLLAALANGQSKVVAPEAVALHGDLVQGPTIGTGPWILEPDRTEEFRFGANPDYFEEGLPNLQELRIVPISGASSRLAALLTGRADLTVVDAEAWDQIQTLQIEVPRGVFPQPGTGILLGLKATHPPFDRLETRQALFQALDPWKALGAVWQGQGDVATGVPVASSQWLLSGEEMRRYLATPGLVETLLAQAGVSPPVAFTLTVADFGDRYLALGEEYRGMLQEAGFEATMRQVNPRVYAEEVWDRGEFQAFLGPVPPVHTTNAFLFGLLHSQGRWSPTGYADAELDRLIQEQSVAGEGRGELVREIQRYALDKAILFMPVTGTSLWVWQERVEGFAPNFAASEYFHWARLRVKEE